MIINDEILEQVDQFTYLDRAVYGRSPAAIVGLNPTGDMDICLLCALCVVR
jgi:hypothetical protein